MPLSIYMAVKLVLKARLERLLKYKKVPELEKTVKISSHTFICEGVTVEDEVFIGHGVMFTNDKFPRATTETGELQGEADWVCIPTLIKRGASIGSNATIMCGITIGERAMIGAGSVVTQDVPPNAVVAGNPARVIRYMDIIK